MDIMGMVTIFVAVAIILGIAVTILGNTSSSIACWQLEGAKTSDGAKPTTAAAFSAADSDGWAKACASIQTQSQNSFNLLLVVLIVIAAVIILAVVRML